MTIDIFDGARETRLSVDLGWSASNKVKAIPGALFDRPSNCWTVPLSWPAAIEVGHVAAQVRAEVAPTDDAAKWVAGAAEQAERLQAMSTDLGAGTGTEMLFGHQRSGAAWLAADTPDFPGRLLLDETGAGKTRTVIEAMTQIDRWPALVVTLNTVKESWRREFELVRPDLNVVVVGGTATQRRKQLATEADVYIINYESVRAHSRLVAFPGQSLRRCEACGGDGSVKEANCQKHPKELNREWSVVVADEVHRIKDPKALQTQAMWGVAESAHRRWGLTGTIIANKPEDLWAPLRFIDPWAWPVKSKWVEMYCEAGYNWFGIWEVTGLRADMQPYWDRWWNPINRRVLKEQVLDLPPLLRGGTLVRRIPMKKEQEAAYVELRDTMVAEIRGGMLVAQNALVQAGRLTTLASASGKLIDGGKEFVLAAPSNKIEAFIADWKAGDFPGSTVVAMSSRQLLLLLSAELTKAGHESDHVSLHGLVNPEARSAAIARFQSGEVPLLLMTYATGGTGITLTRASQMVLLQRDWSAVAMKQGIDRIHRIGSEIHDTVTVHDYITPGTIEEVQVSRLAEKADLLESIVRDAARLEAYARGEI